MKYSPDSSGFPAMLGKDAQGNGLPAPGDKGSETMQNARRALS